MVTPIATETFRYAQRVKANYQRLARSAMEIDRVTGCMAREMRLPPINTYVVEGVGTGLVKIGKSYDVRSRVRSLQGGSPTHLKVIRSIPFDCERRMHVRFAHLRKHGEWFEFDLEMLTETFHEDILGLTQAHLARLA